MRWVPCDYHKTVDKGHGRIEIESAGHLRPQVPALYRLLGRLAGAAIGGYGSAQRRVGEQSTLERRYFISSLTADAKQLLRAVRGHWGIENKLHWCWTSPSARMIAECAQETVRRTSPCCDTLP